MTLWMICKSQKALSAGDEDIEEILRGRHL